MEYTPKAVAQAQVAEIRQDDVHGASGRSLVRRLRLTDFVLSDGRLDLVIEGLSLPLSIRANHMMVFGDESISALDYLKRVLERGDMIDAVVSPPADDRIPTELFWIHIVYVGEPGRAGAFSKKEDGHFAMRAKSGEKAERIVAKKLHDDFGHSFPSVMLSTPGYFEIRYDSKRIRKPDRKCTVCGLTFEIKKRNRDKYFRVSHSHQRPFAQENHPDGWHAFVFPDMKPRFMANRVIANAIASGLFDAGSDRYDTWAQIRPEAAVVSDPPVCRPE